MTTAPNRAAVIRSRVAAAMYDADNPYGLPYAKVSPGSPGRDYADRAAAVAIAAHNDALLAGVDELAVLLTPGNPAAARALMEAWIRG